MKKSMKFEEWKELVAKNRQALNSKSNIFNTEPESLTYAGSKNSPRYNPVPKPQLIATFNITDTSRYTPIFNASEPVKSYFDQIEIDGVIQSNVEAEYQFDTIGEHTVKYVLADPSIIGEETFRACNDIKDMIIPESVTTIGKNAFATCRGLADIIIPNSVKRIEEAAFDHCDALTAIAIPDNVEYIGPGALNGTDKLTILQYNAQCELNSSFRGGWPLLETVIIGDSTPSIGAGMFSSCTNLKNVTIGKNVISIGAGAFSGCGLTTIKIPSSVTSIGGGTFTGCGNLKTVTIDAITPPTSVNEYTFANNADERYIHVPAESLSAYKTAEGWSNYADYIVPILRPNPS